MGGGLQQEVEDKENRDINIQQGGERKGTARPNRQRQPSETTRERPFRQRAVEERIKKQEGVTLGDRGRGLDKNIQKLTEEILREKEEEVIPTMMNLGADNSAGENGKMDSQD